MVLNTIYIFVILRCMHLARICFWRTLNWWYDICTWMSQYNLICSYYICSLFSHQSSSLQGISFFQVRDAWFFFFFKAVLFSYPFVSSLTPSSNLPGIQLTMLLKCILNWSSRLLCNRSLSPYLHTFLLYPYFTFLILYSRIEWSF